MKGVEIDGAAITPQPKQDAALVDGFDSAL